MATTQELRDQRAAAWAQAQAFNERNTKGDDLSAEDETGWAKAIADVDSLTAKISTRETNEKLEGDFEQIDAAAREQGAGAGGPGTGAANTDDAYRAAFVKFCRFGDKALDADEASMLQARFVQPQAAQGTTSGAAGGYSVPEGFWAKVTETMKYFGGATNGAEDITTDSGAPLPWPTNDDTANVGYMLGENVQATSEGDIQLGQKALSAYFFVSGPIKLSLALIQDSGIDFEALVARKMGERIARARNAKHTTGTGSSQPQGYITGLTTGKTTASATVVTYNEIIDLEHSVDAAYRGTGRCRYKFHDLVFAELRKIRDDSGGAGVGRPLWQPSIQAGAADTFNGYGYDINNDMDSAVTATKTTMAFGDFLSAFAVRLVTGGQMMRLVERYADYLQVAFLGYQRADSIVQDASAAKLLVQHS